MMENTTRNKVWEDFMKTNINTQILYNARNVKLVLLTQGVPETHDLTDTGRNDNVIIT